MYGILDCNNFYVSCERLFRPDLNGRPVVVLSNNDGCVVSRSNEVKALGIPMGIPLFKIQEEVKKYGIVVCSSNYELYGDLSQRVMAIVQENVPQIEKYSIDECFIKFDPNDDYIEMAKVLNYKILKGVGIPTCIGISSTKTLAKLANRVAKKHPEYQGTYAIDNNEKWLHWIKWVDIEDIWGIGRRSSKKLHKYGVFKGYDFVQRPPEWVRQHFTITGLNTYLELKGKECIEFAKDDQVKSISRSRSFSNPISDESTLFSILLEFAEMCCSELVRQSLAPLCVAVILHTNRFSVSDLQQHEYAEAHLTLPTNNLSELTPVLYKLLKELFREGYKYKKAGVLFTQLVHQCEVLPFVEEGREALRTVSSLAKQISDKYGNKALYVAARNPDILHIVTNRKWTSPRYTTVFDEILTIHPKTNP